jgi:hypothetical protein
LEACRATRSRRLGRLRWMADLYLFQTSLQEERTRYRQSRQNYSLTHVNLFDESIHRALGCLVADHRPFGSHRHGTGQRKGAEARAKNKRTQSVSDFIRGRILGYTAGWWTRPPQDVKDIIPDSGAGDVVCLVVGPLADSHLDWMFLLTIWVTRKHARIPVRSVLRTYVTKETRDRSALRNLGAENIPCPLQVHDQAAREKISRWRNIS